jgi:two-component system, LytTR family, sensor kinase
LQTLQPYSLKKFSLYYLLWWSVWVIVHIIVVHRLGINWGMAVIDSLISNTVMAMACSSAILLFRYYQPGLGKRVYRFIFAIVITILFCDAVWWILTHLFPDDKMYLQFLENSLPVRFAYSFLMLSFVGVFNWLWTILMEKNQLEVRKNEAEQLIKDAELVKLRQQLQPHFLFNSLNSISALAGSKPDEARKMVQLLSDFLRGTLKKDDEQTVSLKEELEHLNLYLEIEKVRFGNRLNIDIQVSDGAKNAHLPSLLLQPIVENAIKFGIYGTIDTITITINAQLEKGVLRVEITNPYDSQTQGKSGGTGFGLSSIQRRLYLLYSRNDLLNTEKIENVFITRLIIPQLNEKNSYHRR